MTETLLAPLAEEDAVRDGAFPLSATQARIWLDEQLRSGGTAYHMPVVSRVRGPLDLPALREALRLLTLRHPALRTTFHEVDGVPMQQVSQSAAIPLEERDLRDAPEPDAAARAEVDRELRRPFDLGAGPLLRAAALRIADDEHLLVLTAHHLIFDGASFGILFEELGTVYAAVLDRLDPQLPAPRRSYADAVQEEREHISSTADQRLEWWRAYLSEVPRALDLPADHARSGARGHSGAQHRLLLDRALTMSVREFGRKHQATLFTTVLSAFGVVLSRQTGLPRLLVGTPVSTRKSADRGTLGCFLETLPVRLDIDAESAFADNLALVKQSAREAFAQQRAPLGRLAAERARDAGPDGRRLFQVLLNVLPPVVLPELRGCTVEQLPFPDIDNKFELTLYVSAVDEQLALDAVYDADLYAPERIADLLEQTSLVLAQAVADPARRVRTFDLATTRALALAPDLAAEQSATYPGPVTARLAAHALRTPDQAALLGSGTAVTFAELEAWTDRLARRLRSHGVGSGDVVAVQATRDVAAVAAIIAVMKAGAIFALLDADYPASELAARAEALAPRAWIVASPGRDLVVAAADVPVLNAADDRTAAATKQDETASALLPAEPGAGDPAYVAFTSGTTGRPRRVIGTHGPLAHFLDWYGRSFSITAEDRISVLSGLGHDPFLRDVLTPLWTGATAVFPDSDPRDTEALAAELRDAAITVAHLTPSLAAALATGPSASRSAAGARSWPALRLVGFGGDVLTWRTVRQWAALAPNADLLNLYGATETPQAVSVYVARKAGEPTPIGEGRVPLGPGIDEVQLLVLTGDRPAALGEIGEVVVRTHHLARYAHPGESRDGFGPDLSGVGEQQQPTGHRLYRTGDLGRLRPDGLTDFLGRVDREIKVRGYRVEPAEIEAALAELPDVHEAVVLAEPDALSGHRLIGALATGTRRPDLAGLRERLAARLPDYQIPAVFVLVDAIPLTANGKQDRAALLALGRTEPSAGAYVAPRGPVQERVAAIWREVLERDRIGARDDFFVLGGHSLLLSRVLVRLRDAFDAEFALRDLFDRPTVEQLAELVDGAQRGSAAKRSRPVRHEDESAAAPLSWTQERLWLEEQLRPGDHAYNMPLVLRIHGRLDVSALQTAVDAVVAGHAVLRSRFSISADGEPIQQADPNARVIVREVLVPEADALAQAMRETKRPFDLASGPLMRALVLRTAGEESLLVLTVHHIVFDGWSFAVVLDELSAAYGRALAGQPTEPRSGLQFADVARWQRSATTEEDLDEQVRWWTAHLGDTPRVLELPADHPRPAVQGHRGARLRMSIEPELAEGLRELARSSGGTLHSVLLSAFGVVLSRYCAQEQVLVGTPVANRELLEFEAMAGCFLNTLPIPLDLRGAPGFGELVGRVTDASVAGLAHQSLPFGRLVGSLVRERDLSRSPLVQVLFALQNIRMGEFAAPGLSSELVEVTEANSQFDLNLRMLDTGAEIIGWLDYDAELFDASTAARLAEHLRAVLTAVCAEPSACVATVDLLGADERRQVVRDWNDTAVAWPLERTLTSLLEERASAERVAVRCGDRELDYPELHRRANRLAWRLRELGVGPDVIVGVHMERSVELMVALLAVLKAGGAYLPLDPGYPADRLAFMLADARVPVLLTDPGSKADELADESVHVVEVAAEVDAALPDGRFDAAPEPSAGPDHLAYVIYTSGSTGRPKGVQVPHRGIVNRLLWMQDAYGLGEADTVLQKTPISFDVSVWELFWPLMTGSRLVLADPGGHRDPAYLAGLIQREGVTVCHFVPPMLDTFLGDPQAKQCSSLRLIVCSGEALPAELAARLHRELPGAALENLYGPTEASVDVTRWSSRPDWTRPSVPIGAPIANTQVYVLDQLMAPVPVGVPGELHLGGVQLARAYGGRPELTADRFVPDPFAQQPGARLYRTGDLARWRPDGVLEYLGRIDHQVKVRGFRIELGEIEAALTALPEIGQAVVIVREDEPGERRIVAYLTPSGAGATVPDRSALRTELGRTLPEHMLPAAFVALDALPLSPNGKVDRKALPLPDRTRAAEAAGHREPATDLERRLLRLWQQVLHLDRIGVTENFFEIGGDSMHAVRIAGLAREDGLEIPLTELFARQSVEALAAWLAARPAAAAEQRQVAAFGLLSPEDLAKLRAK